MPAADGSSEARRIFVVTPGFEAALLAELRSHRPATQDLGGGFILDGAPGIVVSPEPPAEVTEFDPVFARQQLPRATESQAASVAALAEAAYAAVEAAVDEAAGPFVLHGFAPTGTEPGLSSRAQLIADELLARLRQRRRRAARFHREPAEIVTRGFADTKLLIQLLLVARDRCWISAAAPRALARGGWQLAPWLGGAAVIPEDRRPPSRAYRKLEEAFLWMGVEPAPRELCVDLGGAPGGWSYTALRRGARVIAVDRAALEPPVRGHPRLTMIEGNAFTYAPPGDALPVDWLLSDVICEPARALAQLQRWLGQRWCRHLVMTVKFKGQEGYGMLADVRAALEEAGCPQWRIKHLQHNKNEVTVMAIAGTLGATRRAPV